MSHTKTPWRVSAPTSTWVSGTWEVRSDVDQPDTTVCVVFNGHGNAEDNACRIVACVNACEGISTDALHGVNLQEKLASVDGIVKRALLSADDYCSQRDELLTVLNEIVGMCEAVSANNPRYTIHKAAKEAIARVKGGAA